MKAFETTLLSAYKGQEKEIIEYYLENKALDNGNIVPMQKGISQVAHGVETLIQWEHPIVIESDQTVFIDTRPFMSNTGAVKNRSDYAAAIMRAKAEYMWAFEKDSYEGIAQPLSLVYSHWISNTVQQRFNASLEDIEIIRAAAYCYYWLLCQSEQHDEDEVKFLISKLLVRELRLVSQFSSRIIDSAIMGEVFKAYADGVSLNLNVLCRLINELTTSPAIELTPNSLITLSATGSWIGFAAAPQAALALEHPPTIAYMIITGTESTFYRKTRIGSVIYNNRRKGRFETVSRWLHDRWSR